jgi:hypothetical protein
MGGSGVYARDTNRLGHCVSLRELLDYGEHLAICALGQAGEAPHLRGPGFGGDIPALPFADQARRQPLARPELSRLSAIARGDENGHQLHREEFASQSAGGWASSSRQGDDATVTTGRRGPVRVGTFRARETADEDASGGLLAPGGGVHLFVADPLDHVLIAVDDQFVTDEVLAIGQRLDLGEDVSGLVEDHDLVGLSGRHPRASQTVMNTDHVRLSIGKIEESDPEARTCDREDDWICWLVRRRAPEIATFQSVRPIIYRMEEW